MHRSLELSNAMREIFPQDSKKDFWIECIRSKLSHPHMNSNAKEHTGDLLDMMGKVKDILHQR